MAGMIAVVIMVDSSWKLATHWSHVLAHYISPILSKLIENRSNTMFYLGFLTYATSDFHPNPIFTKRYFAHPQHVTKELREDSQKLGIGQTRAGGSGGMAVLEGYIAVLEMFDYFMEQKFPSNPETGQRPTDIPLTCHLIHVAYANPDAEKRPLWNHDDLLDDVSFDDLPEQLRKRNINLDIITLRPNERLAELHKQTTANPSTCWFPVRAGHTVLLSGFPTSTATGGSSSINSIPKAAAPPVVENILSSDVTSKSNRQTSVSVSQTDTPPNPKEAPRTHANLSALRIFQQMRAIEAQVKLQMQEMQALQQAGRTQEAEDLKKSIQTKTTMFAKLKVVLRNLSTSIAVPPSAGSSQQAQTSNQMPTASSGNGNGNNSTQLSIPLIGNEPSSHESSSSSYESRKAPAELLTTGAAGRSTSTTVSAEALANQMQKLEQQQQHRAQTSLSQPAIQIQNSSANSTKQVWQGTLTWTGPDPVSHMERAFNAEVIATPTAENNNIRPETWPSVLSLVPSKERSISVADLAAWMKRCSPKICSIAAQARTIDKETNEFNFKSLHAFLLEKNIYACVAWQLPSGKTDITMVIFPIPQQKNLAAAVFPETGVPELPKSGLSADLQSQNPTSSTSAAAVRSGISAALPPGYQNWTLQQRQEFAAQVLKQRQIHLQMQYINAQNQANHGVNTANNPMINHLMPSTATSAPFLGGGGMMNQAVINSSMVRDLDSQHGSNLNTGFIQPQQQTVPQATQSGSGGNVSMEMMQSFIQRNPDNINGP